MPELSDSSTHLLDVPPLPYSCKIRDTWDNGTIYIVEVSELNFWTCSCPFFVARGTSNTRWSFYCEHCRTASEITGIALPEYKWRAKYSDRMLTGDFGESGMRVNGYVTVNELSAKFTKGQIKKFIGELDEVALFDDGGERELFLPHRVVDALESPEFQRERAAHLARVAKSRVTRERKKQEKMIQRQAERASFDGEIFVANLEFRYGWERWGVYARDIASARTIFEQELTSAATKEDVAERFCEAMEEHRLEMKSYREELREHIREHSYSNINKPVKPVRSDFMLKITSVEPVILDKEKFEINEVELIGWGGEYYPKDVEHIEGI